MKELVENLKLSGVLKTPAIIAAFLRADRKRFVPPEFQKDAYRDAPLPIGKGQTISQPATVAFMFELLQAKPGDRVLDIGFGSGWTAALLSEIVGPGGKVFALEVVPEVYEFGKRNLERAGYKNVTTLLRSGSIGLPEHAPFERIIAGALIIRDLRLCRWWKRRFRTGDSPPAADPRLRPTTDGQAPGRKDYRFEVFIILASEFKFVDNTVMKNVVSFLKWLVALAIVLGAAFLIYGSVKINQPYKTEGEPQVFVVPSGATTKEVAGSLEEEGLISSAFFFTD